MRGHPRSGLSPCPAQIEYGWCYLNAAIDCCGREVKIRAYIDRYHHRPRPRPAYRTPREVAAAGNITSSRSPRAEVIRRLPRSSGLVERLGQRAGARERHRGSEQPADQGAQRVVLVCVALADERKARPASRCYDASSGLRAAGCVDARARASRCWRLSRFATTTSRKCRMSSGLTR